MNAPLQTAQTLQAVLDRAVAAGLLPAGARAPAVDSRPWPVLLLVALGAWLAALPLLGVVVVLLGDQVQQGAGLYIVAALLLTGALVVLRSAELPVFVEQLALPALLVGATALAFVAYRDLDARVAPVLLAALAVALAAGLPRPWLRVLLGAAAAAWAALACMPADWDVLTPTRRVPAWWALHMLLAVWLAAGAALPRLPPRSRALLETLRAGWLVLCLAGLAAWSGVTLLVDASLGGPVAGIVTGAGIAPWQWPALALHATSAALALAAALTAAATAQRRWPALRQPALALAALVGVGLAACMPALGAALLALACSAAAARWRLALLAALAAAWVLGSFYYALSWPLQTKAAGLLAAGALLAWAAARLLRQQPGGGGAMRADGSGRARAGLALSTLAVLAVVNTGIWRNESLIRDGEPWLVELAPADPRSLLQGDFMRLRFTLPAGVREPAGGLLGATRAQVLARRDARGVAVLRAADPGEPAAPGETRIELTPKNGDWVLVTDAWFFAEGEAARWSPARYGEFRIDAHGRALLVGLRSADLRPL